MDRYKEFLGSFSAKLKTKGFVHSFTLHGSYCTGEYVPFYSDIDYFLVIDDWEQEKITEIYGGFEQSLPQKLSGIIHVPNILTLGEVGGKITQELCNPLIKAIIMDCRKVIGGKDIYAKEKMPSIKEMKPWAMDNLIFHNIKLRKRGQSINEMGHGDFIHNLSKIFKVYSDYLILSHNIFVSHPRHTKIVETARKKGLDTTIAERVLEFRKNPKAWKASNLKKLYADTCAATETIEKELI